MVQAQRGQVTQAERYIERNTLLAHECGFQDVWMWNGELMYRFSDGSMVKPETIWYELRPLENEREEVHPHFTTKYTQEWVYEREAG